ncbi:hypothetical protein HU200_047369 [Digitaria exilis]|uniref:GDSL esterase/lipase n=1 Tax=Digitaria exilis TaxID=1010633 RepID=A0A835EA93_9POAL|nr:hypothetical protein HU200_047369 [Digitaria exilis]
MDVAQVARVPVPPDFFFRACLLFLHNLNSLAPACLFLQIPEQQAEAKAMASCGGRGGAPLLFPAMVVVAAAAALVGAAAPPPCYARVFSFGDSLADTGNHRFVYGPNDTDPAVRLPYGETFFHRATGRFSNGRIVLDFVANALGLPFVRPYLSGRRAEDFASGANFAVGGATALAPDFFRDRGFDMGDDVVHLDMEMGWFRDMLGLLCPGDLAGAYMCATLVASRYIWSSVHDPTNRQVSSLSVPTNSEAFIADCSDMMSQSLFLVGEIGGNDYNLPLLARMPFDNVTAFAPIVIAKISSTIAVSIRFDAPYPSLSLTSCTPETSDNKEDYEPETGCIGWLNEFARYHNKLLIEELEKLRKLHPGVTIIYADNYGAAMEVFLSPEQYGIEYPLVACCGGEGPYGVSVTSSVKCGRGKYRLCRNPGKYGSWDGMHPSEAVYRAIAMGLLRGSYMKPPLATTANSCTYIAELGFSIESKPL